jgi:hypothetical protein
MWRVKVYDRTIRLAVYCLLLCLHESLSRFLQKDIGIFFRTITINLEEQMVSRCLVPVLSVMVPS